MISPQLKPLRNDPIVFNVDTKYLDHHPIFMQFQYQVNHQQTSQLESKTKEMKVSLTLPKTAGHYLYKVESKEKQEEKVFPSITFPPSKIYSPSTQCHSQTLVG